MKGISMLTETNIKTVKISYNKHDGRVVALKRNNKTGMFFLEVSTEKEHFTHKFTLDPMEALNNFNDFSLGDISNGISNRERANSN